MHRVYSRLSTTWGHSTQKTFSLNPAALQMLRSDSIANAYKGSSKPSVPAIALVNLYISGNVFFIENFCECKFQTVISGFFHSQRWSGEQRFGELWVKGNKSWQVKKNKLSDNRSLRNVNKICRSRTVASASRNRNLFSQLSLVMFSVCDKITETGD